MLCTRYHYYELYDLLLKDTLVMDYQEVTYEGCIIHKYPDGSCTALGQKAFTGLKKAKEAIRMFNKGCSLDSIPMTNLLAPLPKAVPCVQAHDMFPEPCYYECTKQEGKTPMRYNDNYASASASVQARPSDSEVSRDYLLGRLRDADYPKQTELTALFNLYKDNTPKTYKEMIDIIKAGTYTIDAKIAKKIEASIEDDDLDYVMSTAPLWGIIWPGPVSDYDGYKLAMTEKTKQKKEAEGVIMTSDAPTGLAAVKAFEAWLPTTATATAQ